MLSAMGDVVWRAALLLLLGLAPYAAPLDPLHGANAGALAAGLHLLLVLAFVVVAALRVRAVRAREPWALVVGVALAAALVLLSSSFVGERGPLARGAWVACPLAWLFVAAMATDPVARALEGSATRARVRVGLGAAALVIAAVSLLAARGRLTPRDRLWEQTLAADPGNEHAALAIAEKKRQSGDLLGALATVRACTDASPTACRCSEQTAGEEVDQGEYEDARKLLEATASCEPTWLRAGALAEARIGTGDLDGGITQADWVLAQKPDDARSLYARGWAMWLKGDGTGAEGWATRAVAQGRGVPAELLLGSLLFQRGDLPGAQKAFRAALDHDPKNARATYDLALVAHKEGRYHDAREGYLRALGLDARYLEARYNLVVLTHEHGANAEAQHHFVEFAMAAPNDARVAQLRAILGSAAPQ